MLILLDVEVPEAQTLPDEVMPSPLPAISPARLASTHFAPLLRFLLGSIFNFHSSDWRYDGYKSARTLIATLKVGPVSAALYLDWASLE